LILTHSLGVATWQSIPDHRGEISERYDMKQNHSRPWWVHTKSGWTWVKFEAP
jgi:hypothetical protein